MRRGLWRDVSCAKELGLSPSSPLTCHELGEGLRAGGRDGQRKLVDGYSVGYSKAVDTTVGHLPSQQLPQQHPKTVGKTKGLCSLLYLLNAISPQSNEEPNDLSSLPQGSAFLPSPRFP